MAFDDHADWRWDDRLLQTLASVATSFRLLCAQLSAGLARFGGYAGLYASALRTGGAGSACLGRCP